MPWEATTAARDNEAVVSYITAAHIGVIAFGKGLEKLPRKDIAAACLQSYNRVVDAPLFADDVVAAATLGVAITKSTAIMAGKEESKNLEVVGCP
jgi:hypothetical protein